MASTVIQLNVVPKRMLTKSEAAQHCGRSVKRFQVECPTAPMKFSNGDLRWDIKDLDLWLDAMKPGGAADLDIVDKLG